MAKSKHFQFGIGRLIALTTAAAVVMAASIRLDAPQFAQWIFAGYLAFFAGWAVMRGPEIYSQLLEVQERRRTLRQRRSRLESEAVELRRTSHIAESGENESSLP